MQVQTARMLLVKKSPRFSQSHNLTFGEAELLAVELHCTPVVKNREIVFADGHTASNTPDLF